MNLVSKIATMGLVTLSINSYADESKQCSTIVIDQSDDFILDIGKVDSKPVEMKKNYRKIMSGRTEYQVAPGEHVISFLQYPKAYFQMTKSHFGPRASGKGLVDVKLKVMHIDIKPDHQLKVGLTENSDSAALTLISQKQELCVKKKNNFIGFENTLYVDKEPLPVQLNQRLSRVMKRIKDYHQQTKSYEANVTPISMDEYFGTVIDDNFSESNHIKVLSVLPFSLAAKLGLKSGDLITKLANKPVDVSKGNPRALFDRYLLAGVKYYDPIILQVIRNNEVLELRKDKRLTIIPGSHYSFNTAAVQPMQITNTKKMDPQLAFDYHREILALHSYYEAKGITADKVRLFRDKTVSKSLGIKGKELGGVGLLILSIAENSPMKKLGLNKNDIIIGINNAEELIDTVSLLLSQVEKLQMHDKVSLLVKRAGKEQELKGIFQPEMVPGFSLALDMNAEQYIKDYRKRYRKLGPSSIGTATWSPGGQSDKVRVRVSDPGNG